MSDDNMPKTPPQAEITQPEPAKPEDVGVEPEVPEMHPVHKSKMTFMIVLTMFLGIVSIASLIFMIKVRDGEGLMFKFPQRKPAVVNENVQESTESMGKPQKKPGEFNPSEIVKELDELKIEEIEKSYLDSGLN